MEDVRLDSRFRGNDNGNNGFLYGNHIINTGLGDHIGSPLLRRNGFAAPDTESRAGVWGPAIKTFRAGKGYLESFFFVY